LLMFVRAYKNAIAQRKSDRVKGVFRRYYYAIVAQPHGL